MKYKIVKIKDEHIGTCYKPYWRKHWFSYWRPFEMPAMHGTLELVFSTKNEAENFITEKQAMDAPVINKFEAIDHR